MTAFRDRKRRVTAAGELNSVQTLHTPHQDSVDEALAAGLLEDLLAWHGAAFIERVYVAASLDACIATSDGSEHGAAPA